MQTTIIWFVTKNHVKSFKFDFIAESSIGGIAQAAILFGHEKETKSYALSKINEFMVQVQSYFPPYSTSGLLSNQSITPYHTSSLTNIIESMTTFF